MEEYHRKNTKQELGPALCATLTAFGWASGDMTHATAVARKEPAGGPKLKHHHLNLQTPRSFFHCKTCWSENAHLKLRQHHTTRCRRRPPPRSPNTITRTYTSHTETGLPYQVPSKLHSSSATARYPPPPSKAQTPIRKYRTTPELFSL